MSRYINATDITKQIAKFKKTVNSPNSDYMTGYLSALSVTEGMIANTPTADVIEVVRCKDCIYNSNGSCTHSEIYDDPNYNPDYYCADGERREE